MPKYFQTGVFITEQEMADAVAFNRGDADQAIMDRLRTLYSKHDCADPTITTHGIWRLYAREHELRPEREYIIFANGEFAHA